MEYRANGQTFTFTTDIRDDPARRESFFALARRTFGLDFEPWYRGGGWQDRYIPHALVLDGAVAANISVNPIDFMLDGTSRPFVQLGTVMTHPDFRGMGLSRFLMEAVLQIWRPRCDCLYLFANDTVLDFYPKFGFVPAPEFQPIWAAAPATPILRQRLDPDDPADQALLLAAYRRSNPYSAFSMEDNEGLFSFYILGPFRECLYSLPGQNAVAILEEDGDTLFCQEILGRPSVELAELLNGLAAPDFRRVVLGFTPNDPGLRLSYSPGEEHLFLLAEGGNPFEERKILFPQISHA
ncbi:MAG: GNAT family N-acetyltransferase [Oscillospiraceae bacterium]|nr:GNAT family N-acetyltransferase [Oscillospiraceae bacterium]